MDQRLRNDVGRAFARYCGVGGMWTQGGPDHLLCEMAHERVSSSLRRDHFVLLRVALDFYDCSGGIGFAEAFRRMDGCTCTDAYFELSEFIGVLAVPDGLAGWLEVRGISSADADGNSESH